MKKMPKKILILTIILLSILCINVKADQKSVWVTEGEKTYYYDPQTGEKLKWWHKDETGVFYLQRDGSVEQGLQTINGIVYYVENNYIYFGEKEIKGYIYVFNDGNGELKYGSVRLNNGKLMLIEKNGNHFKNGWIIYNNNVYYQEDGYLVEGFKTIDNKTYYFEKNTGIRKQWWQQDETGVFYLDYDGSVSQGLQFINGILYYVENNYLYFGEKEIDGKIYVFNQGNGELKYGSVRLENGKLILNDKRGIHFQDGWITYNNNTYYQKDGYILEGFNDIGTKRYYFEKNTGIRKQWWQQDENGIFYLDYDGSIKQGLQKINGIYYYIENDYVYFGDKVIDDLAYKFNQGNGELVTGLFTDSTGNIHYVTKDNKRPKGWLRPQGTSYIYYINNDGNAAVGIVTIEGRDYQFGVDGVLWGFYNENGKMYYKNPDGTIVKGVQYIAGYYYQFNVNTGAFEKLVNQIRVIDVSHNNGRIDWNQVKASGLVDAAILRIGFGSAYLDNEFVYNKNECERLGIPYSVYLFSYGDNIYDALAESNFLVKQIQKYNVHINTNMFSIYYDLEDWEIRNTIYNSYGISQDTYRDMINTFISNTESKLGIRTRVYASTSYVYNRFPADTWDNSTWIADWRGYIGYGGYYEGWQYTNSGYVPGINGAVDISLFYY